MAQLKKKMKTKKVKRKKGALVAVSAATSRSSNNLFAAEWKFLFFYHRKMHKMYTFYPRNFPQNVQQLDIVSFTSVFCLLVVGLFSIFLTTPLPLSLFIFFLCVFVRIDTHTLHLSTMVEIFSLNKSVYQRVTLTHARLKTAEIFVCVCSNALARHCLLFAYALHHTNLPLNRRKHKTQSEQSKKHNNNNNSNAHTTL